MSEATWPDAKTAGDLTTEHYGLEISFDRENTFTGGMMRRTVVCDELRRWVYRGQRRVEVTDMSPVDGFVGTAHMLDAETPVTVHRRIRKARKRPWGKGALKPGEQWPAEVRSTDTAEGES